MCAQLLEAKARKGLLARPVCTPMSQTHISIGLSFTEIGKAMERDEVWVAAVFYGQVRPQRYDCRRLADFFNVGEDGPEGHH